MSNNGFENRINQSQADVRKMLAEWRASKSHETTLPSGLHVTLRDVTMTDLLFTGRLPNSMLDMAQAAADGGQQNIDLKALAKNGQDLQMLVNELVLLCLIKPPVAETPDEEHIGLDELNGEDKMFIFNWANREVEPVRSFREGENEPVAALQRGNELREASE